MSTAVDTEKKKSGFFFKNKEDSKAIATLALMSALVSVLFSFMGAPFLRALATSAKSRFFWGVGITLVSILFISKLPLAAVYVGAVWMTLGFYSELEKRGVNWRKTGFWAVLAGVLFGIVSFMVAIKGSFDHDLVKQVVEPMMQTLQQILPEKTFEQKTLILFMPGILAAALLSSLAVGFIFESQIFQMFSLKREKLVSGLRWLEFRLPDLFIWAALFSFLFSMIGVVPEVVRTIAMNFAIFSVVAFFFQGIVVFEFASRMYRIGTITKFLIYLMIFLWFAPAMGLIGLVDFWADFRKMMRKRIKTNE